MKLQTPSSRALTVALQTAAKCIQNKNTMAILDNVLLSQHDDKQFYFTASTNDSQLTIPAPLNIIEGKWQKSVALPVNLIISYLSTLPECPVNITINENHTLNFDYCTGSDDKVKTGKVSLTWLDAEDFPLMPALDTENNTHICLPGSLFKEAIGQAQNFCADDELRMTMNTLCIRIAKDMSECHLVSSNGHILIKYIHTNDPKTGGSNFFISGAPTTMLIHKSYYKSLSAFNACETIDIETDSRSLRFTSGDIEFICKVVEGNYPNYESVIPKNIPYFITLDKKELLSVIRRVSIFGSESSHLVKLHKNGMFLDVSAEDIDFSTAATDQTIIVNSECQDNFAIGVESRKFASCINAIDGDTVRINLLDPSKAATITADSTNPTVLTLCMPMLLND